MKKRLPPALTGHSAGVAQTWLLPLGHAVTQVLEAPASAPPVQQSCPVAQSARDPQTSVLPEGHAVWHVYGAPAAPAQQTRPIPQSIARLHGVRPHPGWVAHASADKLSHDVIVPVLGVPVHPAPASTEASAAPLLPPPLDPLEVASEPLLAPPLDPLDDKVASLPASRFPLTVPAFELEQPTEMLAASPKIATP